MNVLGTLDVLRPSVPHRGMRWEFALRRWAVFLLFLAVMCLIAAMPGRAAGTQVLHSRLPAAVAKLAPLGNLPTTQHLHFSISLPLRNQQGLTDLLKQISDPSSPNYRHYLTPAQFTEKFGPTQNDFQAVTKYATAQGFKVMATHSNRILLEVDGAVPDIERAFHVKMLNYQHPTEARKFYAPSTAPSVDLAVPILDIIGLDNYSLPHSYCKIRPANLNPATNPKPGSKSQASPQSGSASDGGYAGNDFRTAYVPGTTLTGAGQSIALLEFDGYYASDITSYETQFSLPNVTQVVVPVNGGISSPGSANDEVALDIEMAIAMAPGISAVYVYEAPNQSGEWDPILSRMATDDVAKQISCSWGGGNPDATAEGIFQEMAAQGQSFFTASGDSDAYTGSIPFPCDSPSITVVGGTTLTTTGAGGSYTSETVWNWGNGQGSCGGTSTYYSIPSYQQGVSMITNQGSTTMRNVPDVALTADNVFIDYNNGSSTIVGGTSCAAPLWAGFTALVNQKAVAASGSTVGFINPAVYTIGNGSSYTSDFHDTTTGNNFSTSSPNLFSAVTGYDLCTGWGTPLGTTMINALAGTLVPTITATSPLPSGVVSVSYSQTLTATNGTPSYTYSLASGSLPAGLSLSSGGVISGTPTTAGTASFTVQVTDSKGNSSSTAFAVTIYAQGSPIITTTSPLPSGVATVSYSQTLTASGGTAPLTWSLASGALPTGLSLSSGGVISGTPSVLGTTSFTVQVTDSNGLLFTTPFTLTILPPTPVITSALSVNTNQGAAFSYQITASNNPTSYGASGLPTGLYVSPATGAIVGTPTAIGTSTATITATNSGGTGSAILTITVLTPAPVIVPITTVASLVDATGEAPYGGVTQASDGNFYGATPIAGANNLGTVFKMTPSGTLTTLVSFAGLNGNYSTSPLLLGKDGNLYGTTVYGGSGNNGTVFKITTGGTLTTLVTFNYTNGADPYAGLIQGTDGNFYGTTYLGGANYDGSVFKMTPSGTLTTLFSFNGTNGLFPYGGVIQGSDGNFYGTTYGGGSANDGTVFKLTPSGTLTTLCSFTGTNGSDPEAGVVQGSDGNFYGTTYSGGSAGYGVVFKVTPSGTLTTLCSFTGTNGENPNAPLIQGKDGNFYGTTVYGGSSSSQGDGTLFEITPSGTLTTLCAFSGANGEFPYSPLTLGSDGYYYGATSGGGSNASIDYGTVFKFIPYTINAIIGSPFSYQIQATNAPTSYGASGLPAGLSVNTTTGLISGTPTTLGTYTVPISATNAGGAGTATLTINVIATPPPVISNTLTAAGQEGTAFSYQITASNSPASFGASGLPAGLNVNTSTGLISGTPSVTGTFTATISATNAGGTGSATLTITVVPPTPVITGTLSASGEVGVAFSYQITAANSPTSYGASGLPTGLSVNTSNGLISGTPSVSGIFNATISATNAGGTGSATLAITVQPGPTISITSPGTNAVGLPSIADSLVLTATATSAVNTPAVTWSVVSGPGTVTFANANAASTSATFSTTGTYVLEATVSDGVVSSSATLTVGAGVPVNSTGTTVVDQLSFTGALSDGAASTGTIGGTTWTSLASAESGTTTVTPSTATPLLNLKTSSNASSGIKFTWTNSFAFESLGRGDDGTTASGTATDGLSTYTPAGTSATSGVTFTNGSEFFPWNVMEAYNAVHDGTDGYASFKLSSSTPLAYTFWIASSFDYNNPSSTAWPTLINIGGTYSKTSASFTGGTTLSLQGSQSQSSDNTQRYAIGKLSTTGGFLSTYNASTGLYELNVQIGSGTTSTSSGAVLNGIIFQATQTFTANNAPQVNPGSVSSPVPGIPISLTGTASDDGLPTGSTLTTTWSMASGPTNVTFANPSALSTTVTFPQGGTYVLTLSASDGSASSFQSLTVLVPYIPVISVGTLPGLALTGTAYSYQVVANDTPTSYSATGLPVGLTINSSTGLISGTPTASGVFSLTVNATNASGTGTATFTLTVQGAPLITNAPPAALVNTAYSFSYTSTGYPSPAFSVTAGALPTGLSLSSSGVISGTATASGVFTGTITASNGIGTAATQTFTIVVQQAPSITNGPPPATGYVGNAYSFTYATSGYPVPTFSVTAGALPSGLSLSSAGVISGTPTASGVFTGTITASNGVGTAPAQAFTIVVQQAPSITNGPATATGYVGNVYSFTYATSGYPVPTFSVTAGALPSGLSLSSAGVISGTPTASGVFTGTVTASNGVGTAATQNFTITVFTTYASWAGNWFTTQQSSQSGANATPENDGVANVYKYLFDINPTEVMTAADRAALPTVGTTTVNGVPYLTLTYRANPYVSGITVSVQTSSDLKTWQTVTPNISQTVGTDSATGDPIIEVEVAVTGATRKFINLNVTSP